MGASSSCPSITDTTSEQASAILCRAGGIRSQEALEDTIHTAGVLAIIPQESVRSRPLIVVRITQQAGADCQFFFSSRERVCLRVVDHLKLILDIAQKNVCRGQRITFFSRNERLRAQACNRF